MSKPWPTTGVTLPDTANVFGRNTNSAEFIKKRDELLQQWRAQKNALVIAQAQEMATREEIVALLFDPSQNEGTETIELGNGWKIKAQKKLNYTLGNKRVNGNYNDVEAAQDTIASLQKDGASLIADRIINWKPELSLTEYRRLETEFPEAKAIVDRVLTTKPGSPTLELISPPEQQKGKRK